ncbi:MAG: ABC transporter permease [Bacteroidetes bacterium]|nr:ABC transporter permease [Bacteroidota bacterium]
MRPLWFLLQKEFRQIFRDRGFVGRLFIMPTIQLILLPMAANFTIKNINIAIVDHDHSSVSAKLSNKILSSGYFKLADYTDFNSKANKLIEGDKADIILEIPPKFESNLMREGFQKISIQVNAINGVKASVGFAYLSGIINDFNNAIRLQLIQPERASQQPVIDVISSYWYNPSLTYYIFMVPAILVSLVTGIAGLSAAFNIVKEKEIGTIEQINVTPIKKYQFILGKLLPFVIMGIVVFSFSLLIARVGYGITPIGSLVTLYVFLIVFMFAILGFGLLISTYSETQVQANSLMVLFMMIFNMMSGLFTPLESMPEWAKFIAHLFPVSHFIEVMRMVVIKGSSLYDIRMQLFYVFMIGLVLNTWAILNYRKRA